MGEGTASRLMMGAGIGFWPLTWGGIIGEWTTDGGREVGVGTTWTGCCC
jgi:hypothetical protein